MVELHFCGHRGARVCEGEYVALLDYAPPPILLQPVGGCDCECASSNDRQQTLPLTSPVCREHIMLRWTLARATGHGYNPSSVGNECQKMSSQG